MTLHRAVSGKSIAYEACSLSASSQHIWRSVDIRCIQRSNYWTEEPSTFFLLLRVFSISLFSCGSSGLNDYYIVCGGEHVCRIYCCLLVWPVCTVAYIWNLVQMILNNFVLAFPLYLHRLRRSIAFLANVSVVVERLYRNNIICCRQRHREHQCVPDTHTYTHTLFFHIFFIQLYRLPSI